MFTSRAKKQIHALLIGSFMVALATLACGTKGVIDMLQTTPTPNPTAEAPLESMDPNYVLSLPKEIKGSTGQTFTINRVELFESIDTPTKSYAPQRGIYLWLIGTVGNFTDAHECVRGQDFVLSDGAKRYDMRVEDAEALYELYNLPYPDFFLGHCLDADQTIDSFLIFDIPREAMDLWLEFGNGKGRLGRMSSLIAATPKPAVAAPEIEVQQTSYAPDSPKPIVTAAGSNVNIRTGPGTSYEIVSSLPAGQSLEIVGRNADSSWWHVSTPNGLGWVAAWVTTTSNVDERIPIH